MLALVNEELSLLWPLLNDERGRILWRSFSDEPHRAPLKWLSAAKVDDGSDDRTGVLGERKDDGWSSTGSKIAVRTGARPLILVLTLHA